MMRKRKGVIAHTATNSPARFGKKFSLNMSHNNGNVHVN